MKNKLYFCKKNYKTMPHMNHTGPEGKGPRTGRGLGNCRKPDDSVPDSNEYQVGKGMGLKRKSGGGKGKGRRLQYSENKPKKPIL
jgi:hypothetical protein